MPVTETRRLPLMPLNRGVIVPTMVVNVVIDSDEARAALTASEMSDRRVLLVPRIDGHYAAVGTVAVVEETYDLEGRTGAVLRGVARARLGSASPGADDELWVDADIVEEPDDPGARAHELAVEYRAVVAELLTLRGASGFIEQITGIEAPGQLADTAIYSPDLALERKVELLETIDVEARIEAALGWLRQTLGELTLRADVRRTASERLDKGQREYVLRQQMDAIRDELGEGDDADGEDYRARLGELDAPESVKTAIGREIDRLERASQQSPENGWIRTWLDTMFEIPWGTRSDEQLDLGEAQRVLDADHTGLDDVKERLIEHLAVRKLRHDRGIEGGAGAAGAVLLLVGPPGVGKTSLGESVARAMGREFVRVALGGIRDEAEIRGHRRTYVGARPGRIVRALTDAGTMNPVFLLDEVDKVGNDWRGDPSSALLEVLDPAQNHTFRDHYLELDLDLSDVVFIATANVLDTIPGPLMDRMEVIRLDGYTDAEKVVIAADHLLPRQLERAGLRPDEVEMPADSLREIIDGYTREAGVRGLERALGTATRKLAARIAGAEAAPDAIVVTTDEVRELLGKRKVHHDEAAGRTALPGVSIGLAVTGAGGDVLFVEAGVSDGEEGLTLTGQLGDVMKESATIAMSFVRAHAADLGIDPAALAGRRVHLHVPAGAVPKDGPSAGVTMVTALVSALRGVTVKDSIAMTGEVTLQGRVLPIGGVKQKVLAAHRAGLREVILPALNGDDVDDIPEAVREEMTIHLAADVRDVLTLALTATDAAAPLAA